MARIAGVDIPNNKQGQIALTYIYGIGRSSAKRYLKRQALMQKRRFRTGPTTNKILFVTSSLMNIR